MPSYRNQSIYLQRNQLTVSCIMATLAINKWVNNQIKCDDCCPDFLRRARAAIINKWLVKGGLNSLSIRKAICGWSLEFSDKVKHSNALGFVWLRPVDWQRLSDSNGLLTLKRNVSKSVSTKNLLRKWGNEPNFRKVWLSIKN